jgi:hypothetical protein
MQILYISSTWNKKLYLRTSKTSSFQAFERRSVFDEKHGLVKKAKKAVRGGNRKKLIRVWNEKVVLEKGHVRSGRDGAMFCEK